MPETDPRRPDRTAALAQYRGRAAVYDLELALFEPLRREAVALLGLAAGQTVLDVGCGTGLSLALLGAAVGPRGRVVGIEQSPEMLARARERVRQHRWRNVTLVNAPAESAAPLPLADAALFHFTHDILRRPEAVAHVAARLRPGGRVVASGLKWRGPWPHPVNFAVWLAARRSVTTLEGLREPWDHLAAHLAGLEVRSRLLGAVFLVSGQAAARR